MQCGAGDTRPAGVPHTSLSQTAQFEESKPPDGTGLIGRRAGVPL